MHRVVDSPQGKYDVAILGGGFAGATASRQLTRAGLRVLIIEARDRLAGRMWSQPAYFDGHAVEWGGAFMLDRPSYPLTWKEIDEHDLRLDWGSLAKTKLIWLSDGQRRVGPMPVPLDELVSFERLLLRISELASRIDPIQPIEDQDVADLDVPWPSLLEGLALGPHTRELFSTHIVTLAGDPWDVPSALPLLHTIAKSGSVSAATFFAAPYDTPMARTLGPQLADGTGALHDAVMSGSDADVLLGTEVVAVEDTGADVRVTTSTATLTVEAVVCALPIGVLSGVRFSPGLSPELNTLASQGVAGQAEKVTVFVSNCPEPFYAHGIPPGGGFATASTTFHDGDRAIVVGFTSEAGIVDLDDVGAVQNSLRQYVPDITVDAVAWHDWAGDQYSRGTWSYLRPGQSTLRPKARQRQGRITFAGSDFDARLGVEGALHTGGLAAEEVLGILGR
ncbi:flavin monoamine oxidase family protein [Mycolicibacterium komossense]|uniref:FAD-dependent oxidoreductase n=1 Tax=Mycolicibacterium komossense TaxID=1779 RepID=A0ABT3CBV8_9MYCO|nr:NAD(P)/FAD-dependent oxidoreductase [Mycolicibacterium komossense]MCV7226969.1 FAD-dependent oxidoreductase [Mycolicibacterium komossense]